MLHVWVSYNYIHFLLIYTNYHIFPVIPIKHLLNQDGEPTMPHKLATGINFSVSNLRVLLLLCFVRKVNAHVYTKALNMCHWSQKGYRGIFVGITQHQKGYLICVTSTLKIVSSHDTVFDKTFFSVLVYMPRPYSEALLTRPAVSYILYATSSHEKLVIL